MTDICRQIHDRAQKFRVPGKEGAAEEMLKSADAYSRAEILAGQENAAGVVVRIVLMLSQDAQ